MEQLNIRKPDKASFELVAIRILVIVPTTSKQLRGRPARAFANLCLEFNFNIARSQISHRTSSECESCWGDWEASGNSSGSHSRILHVTLESIRCFWLSHFQPWILNSLGCRWRTSFYPWRKLTRKLPHVRKSFLFFTGKVFLIVPSVSPSESAQSSCCVKVAAGKFPWWSQTALEKVWL